LHTSVTIPPGVRKSDTWFWAAGVLRGSWWGSWLAAVSAGAVLVSGGGWVWPGPLSQISIADPLNGNALIAGRP
jgi:hypothetical protein